MAIIKCKMCGGDLTVVGDSQIAVCEYCGTQQTVPKQDNEKKLTLFARANRLRFACEFDKAAGVYESIVAEFPEEAEAYWGLVLCKYGIEYVDDPSTGKKIPTCHRSSFDSVLEDANFELVMEYSDAVTRKIYREEAKTIEELRRGIIEVSSREEPYDIFICYKETDENGQRTLDSVLAQDLYDALTEKGYRVFFSRITLEDKLGQEYEPYIFAALNSARVMLAVGTDYEYYNAPWVKNEWSRYLQLIAAGQKKSLIPCYKNIDAYDMPKEFAKLQAQDLGKVGATQDLLRGIEKLFGKNNEQKGAQSPTSIAAAPNTDALLRRGHLFLEDKDWENADTYFDKVLDLDPECAEAYLGKLLAQLRITSVNNISCDKIILPDDFSTAEELGCYKKASRFGDGQIKQSLRKVKDTLLRRGQLFLEDKDWENADTYFDKVLDLDPECADAYLGKLLAQLRITSVNNISCDKIILPDDFSTAEELGYYKKASRFGDGQIKQSLQRVKTAVEAKVVYDTACKKMKAAQTSDEFRQLADSFRQVDTFYSDARNLTTECTQMMEVFRENENRYSILAEQLAKQTEELGLLQDEAREFEKKVRDEMHRTQEACDEIPFFRVKERQQKQKEADTLRQKFHTQYAEYAKKISALNEQRQETQKEISALMKKNYLSKNHALEGVVPSKLGDQIVCPLCGSIQPSGRKKCFDCGVEFVSDITG